MILFSELITSKVTTCVATREMWETPVFAEEEQLISNSVEKRQREFRAGRHCAHLALEIAGCHNVPAIMAGSYRQPLWPIGFIGSISHCQDLCLAAVAVIGNGGIFSLGIDVELANPIPIEIYNHVFVLNELEALNLEKSVAICCGPLKH